MQEAKRQIFDSLYRSQQRSPRCHQRRSHHPRRSVWGSLLFVLIVAQTSALYADSEGSDILDRRDVQSILFDNSVSNYFDHESLFRGEFVGGQKSVAVNAYYLKRLSTYVKSQWGATYEEMNDHSHLVGLKGAVFLNWDRYFAQPLAGVDVGYGVLPGRERNLFSHAILGMDFQVAHNFGISARESWGFSNYSFDPTEPFYFRLENAMFEVALFWQI